MAIMIAVFYCMFMFADLENEKADRERHNERSVNFEEMSDQESEEKPAGSLVNYCKVALTKVVPPVGLMLK
jgi:hypothetical protein